MRAAADRAAGLYRRSGQLLRPPLLPRHSSAICRPRSSSRKAESDLDAVTERNHTHESRSRTPQEELAGRLATTSPSRSTATNTRARTATIATATPTTNRPRTSRPDRSLHHADLKSENRHGRISASRRLYRGDRARSPPDRGRADQHRGHSWARQSAGRSSRAWSPATRIISAGSAMCSSRTSSCPMRSTASSRTAASASSSAASSATRDSRRSRDIRRRFTVRAAGPGSWGNRVFVKVEPEHDQEPD